MNDTTYCAPCNTISDAKASSIKAAINQSYFRMIVQTNTPRRIFSSMIRVSEQAEDDEISCLLLALDGLTQGMGVKHWRYTTMDTIARRTGASVKATSTAVDMLHRANFIHVQPKYTDRSSPLLMTWMLFASRDVAAHVQYDKEMFKVSANQFHGRLKPSIRIFLGGIIPPEELIVKKSAKVLKFRRGGTS